MHFIVRGKEVPTPLGNCWRKPSYPEIHDNEGEIGEMCQTVQDWGALGLRPPHFPAVIEVDKEASERASSVGRKLTECSEN